MELCTVQANHAFSAPIPSSSLLLPKSSLSLRQTPLIRTAGNMLSRSISLSRVLPRATTSDGASQFVDEKRDGAIILEDVQTTNNNALNGIVATEEAKEESPVDEQVQPFDFAEKLNVKTGITNSAFVLGMQAFAVMHFIVLYTPILSSFDTDDTGSILLYGGGAIVVLWLASAVVGAIDSIPLIPKLLEVVGLSYTLWFTYRYLLFKKNRDELGAKFEELKEQILGSEDD
ncbi:Protein CURVATURE THYLAKOID 1D, chloroplastic [Senna tora]|uniref:Protein CURVATURE THYLAKOID 1D, chloroplastic n=1 Tax=Senna tora TaxID=362788 RepID=A0A834WQ46_9FABA|nr:Protein CURVATURE THYLAKOID 1D, chloroplastic [Senna tora]